MKYDFGVDENIKRYGSMNPPEYDLKKIVDVPIALLCGNKDMLSSPEDYKWLKEILIDNNTMCCFKEYNLGHLGILMPKDRVHVYDMLELCKAYNTDYEAPKNEPNDFERF
jgi:hypothetical protein